MSRTFVTTPTRRSRRLLRNGYYRVQVGEHDNVLELPASDEDDTASVDSNISRISEQRNISYKESPTQPTFTKRRHGSKSPNRISNSLLDIPQQKKYENISYSEGQLHRLQFRKTSSSVTYSDQETLDSYNIHVPNNFAMMQHDVGDVHKARVSSTTSRSRNSRVSQRRKFAQHIHEGAEGDSIFKVPTGNSSKIRPKIQNQSLDYTLSDEDFLKEDMGNNDAANENLIATVESGHDIKEVQQNVKSLELSLRAIESSFSQRHTSVLDAVDKIQRSNEEKEDSHLKSQKEMLASINTMITKSIETEVLKVSEKFETRIANLQLELNKIQEKYSINVKYIRDMSEKYESEKRSQEPNKKQLQNFEEHLLRLERRISDLLGEYNAFKASVNRFSGNVTYLQQLSNEQFIANFQAILEDSNNLVGQQKNRHDHLSQIFVMWLEKKGFVEKDALEKMKSEITANTTRIENHFRNALETSVTELKMTFFEESRKTSANIEATREPLQRGSSEMTERLVKAWIKEALDLYSADRVGEADFALESAGGSVVNTRCSETFHHKTALVSILGIPIYYNVNTPRSVIQPTVLPGQCWAFQGSKGYLVISLSTSVRPTGFSLDHIPLSLSLTKNISSAPKDFEVYGLNSASDPEGILLGTYRFEKDGESVQRFTVASQAAEIEKGFDHIELRITSNWGHPSFTCIYRFRVHGNNLR